MHRPSFLTADVNVANRLARIAGMEPEKIGGFEELLRLHRQSGFTVAIESRTIAIVPMR
jgi:hypothetical protein